ncbi:conserved domain protein [Verrucomicrobiia bacterium DG1235]|nr:conserved domain protein [Verrucomicrobiae bacterium DG1235]
MKKNLPLLCISIVSIFCLQSVQAADEWISLFDGKSFDGWKINERPESWAIEDGCIVTKGERSHLFYAGEVADHDFKNFVFSAEVMTSPGANSGLYIHTKFQDEGWPAAGYECQVINSNPEGPANYIEHKMTGSVYAVRNTWEAPAADNVWFSYKIRVQGKTIQTYIDGRLICEYTEPDNAWRPDDKKERLLGSGTFAIQAHDPGSIVRYRNIRVKLLPDDLPTPGKTLSDKELDQLVTSFSNSNHALVDIGIDTPSLSYAQKQVKTCRTYGLSFIAADISQAPANLLVVNDRDSVPNVEALKAAKAAGAKIVFSSGGATDIDEARLKARLQAMQAADLGWSDLWVPGK